VLSGWKRIFEPDHGVWLDVWVLKGNPADWALLDWACRKHPTNLEDGVEATLPSLAMILERVKTVTSWLRIDLGGFSANAHFLSTDLMELGVLPASVDAEAKAPAVFKLMTGIARRLRKEVIFAPEPVSLDERQPQARAVWVADFKGNLSPGDVERERVRCGL
jgi:hypothetical protein